MDKGFVCAGILRKNSMKMYRKTYLSSRSKLDFKNTLTKNNAESTWSI